MCIYCIYIYILNLKMSGWGGKYRRWYRKCPNRQCLLGGGGKCPRCEGQKSPTKRGGK